MDIPETFGDVEAVYVYQLDQPIDFDDQWHPLASVRIELGEADRARFQTSEDRESIVAEAFGGWNAEGQWFYNPSAGGDRARSMAVYNECTGKTHLVAMNPLSGAGELVAVATTEIMNKVMVGQAVERRIDEQHPDLRGY